MNRWKFLAIYQPSAAVCWGIGYLAGVRNGTGASVAVGASTHFDAQRRGYGALSRRTSWT